VRDLELIATGDEFPAVPEAAGRLHGHHIYTAGNHTHDPTYHIVHSVEIHITLILNEWQRTRFSLNYKIAIRRIYGQKIRG
jgi:hypothetical protein